MTNLDEVIRSLGLSTSVPWPDLFVLAGSRGFGLGHADSDFDFQGVFTTRTTILLGLGNPPQTISQKTNDADLVMHEAGKFVGLALSANPTILEALHLRAVRIPTAFGRALQSNASAFFSIKAASSYGGFASQQLARIKTSGTRPANEKNARHFLRLIDQGTRLLSEGVLNPVVSDPERYFAFGKLPDAEVLEQGYKLLTKFDAAAAKSVLPEHPDRETVNEILVHHRVMNLTTLERDGIVSP
jgi:predicted nucleotidyltransferase